MMMKHIILIVIGFFLLSGKGQAIEVNPSREAVDQAIESGKDPNVEVSSTNRFGDGGNCGWGMVQTKLWYVWVGSRTAAKNLKVVTHRYIEDVLSFKNLSISYMLCTDDGKRVEHQMVLKQGETIIQPVRVDSSIPASTHAGPDFPKYITRVVGFFEYSAFDPQAETTIYVQSSGGMRKEQTVNLSSFK